MPRELSLAEIFQVAYYWETKILLTAVKLDLFSALSDRAFTTDDLATHRHLNVRALTVLMNALVAMRVLRKEEARYSNTGVGQKYLVKSSPEYVGHLLLLHDAEWAHWTGLEETVRTGRSPVTQHVFETDPEMGANVLAVLHRIGKESGPTLATRLDLQGAKQFLDLGGGAGTNAIAFCQAYPELNATVFDLPQTLTLTQKKIQEANLESRITLLPGNFHADSLGGPYDVVLMSDILHYQDGETNAALVRKVFDHLVGGGRLVLKDRFLDPSCTSPAWTTAFAVHILVNTECGQCFTSEEVRGWMNTAGLDPVTEIEPHAIVQGVRPKQEEGGHV